MKNMGDKTMKTLHSLSRRSLAGQLDSCAADCVHRCFSSVRADARAALRGRSLCNFGDAAASPPHATASGDVAAQRQGARRRRLQRRHLASAELYDVGLGFSSAWQPKIHSLKLTGGTRLLLKGSLFQGISQASGGNTQDSSSNYPIVQLRSLDNSEIAFLLVAPVGGWSDTSFISRPVRDFPFGRLW